MRVQLRQHRHPGKRWPLAPLFFLYYVCIGMFITIGVTVGDTLFLTHSGANNVTTFYAWAHVGVALGMMLVTWGYARVMEHVSRITLIIGLQAVLLGSLLLFHQWLISEHMPKTIWTYFGLLIWLKVCGQVLIMVFFSFAGDYFTTRKARQVYGYLAGGLAVGSVLAGLLMKPLLSVVTTLNMLYACMGLLLAGIGFARLIAAHGVPLTASASPSANCHTEDVSMRRILRHPYLVLLFLVTFLRVVCFVFVDFQMKMTVGATYVNSAELAGFFGDFYMYLGLVTIAAQFLVGRVLLQKFGILACLMLLPCLYLVMGGVFYSTGYGMFPGYAFWIITATNFLRLLLSESLDLPARELLLLPLPPGLRVKSQAVMAGIIEPFSQGLGGLGVIGLSAFGMRLFQYSGGIMLCAVLWLVALLFERPRYQRALLASLHDVHLSSSNLQDIFLTPHSEQVVLELLQNPKEEVIGFTLNMLKNRPLKTLTPHIYALARQSAPDIAAKAIELLGQDGAATHLPLLKHCLHGPAPETRKAAILAVCQIQQHDAHEQIRQWLVSSDRITSEAALIGAGRFAGHIGQRLIAPILQQMATSSDPAERLRVAEILSEIGQSTHANIVRPLLADHELAVRMAAVRACGALRAYEQVPQLIRLFQETALRTAVFDALKQMPQESVPVIIGTVYEPDFDETLRDIVFQVLASIGGPVAHDALWAFFVSHAPVVTRVSSGHALQRLAQREEWQLKKGDFAAGFRVLCENIRELNRACQEIGDSQQMLWRLLHDQVQLEIECLFLLLSYQYGIRQIRQIHVNFFSSTGVQWANAIELLDELLPRRIAADVVRLLDDFGQPCSADAGQLSTKTIHRLHQREPWLRMLVEYFAEDTSASSASLLSAYEREIYRHVPDVLFLKNIPLFEDVPGNYLVALTHIAQPVRLSSGDRLFSEGDPGNAMYLICQGTIQELIGERELTCLGKGDCIGEMSLLDGAPRSASGVAVEDTELLMLPGQDVERLLLNQASVALALLRTLAARLRQQTRHVVRAVSAPDAQGTPADFHQTSFSNSEADWEHPEHERLSNLLQQIVFFKRVPLFQNVPEQYWPALAELTRQINLHPGETLFHEGDVGDALYIIQRGAISVQVTGNEVNRMREGECIGEMSLLDHTPRSAACVACEATTLLRMSAADFDTVVRSQPRVLLALLRTVSDRLRHQTAQNSREPGND